MGLATFGAGNRSKSPARRFPRWVIVLVTAIALAGFLTLFAIRYLEVYRLNREATRLTTVRRSLQEQNAILREEMKLLHTPGYVEKIAREQLGLVRPGEIAVLVVTRPAPRRAPPAALEQERGSLVARIVQRVMRVLSP